MHTVENFSGRLNSPRAASTASGGTALTTTAGLISIPLGADWISVTPRNFVGCGVARFTFNPYLTIVVTNNLLLTPGTDVSAEAQDGDTTAITAFNSLDTLANGDAVYIGAVEPFRGVGVVMSGANSVASNLSVDYWDGATWTAVSTLSDGTDTGAAFATNGNITWDVPALWAKSSLKSNGAVTASDAAFKDSFTTKAPYIANLYFVRVTTSAAFDASSEPSAIRALNRYTSYAELLEGQVFESTIKSEGPGGVACVEALTDAGTANLIVNVAIKHDGEYE